jgi:transcriptional regulator with XRE-family HTH domain
MVDKLPFGQWLQLEREKRNWSQSELARRAKLHRAIISKIELSISSPATETYIALADALDVSPIFLFHKAGLLPDHPGSENQVAIEDWQYLLDQLPLEDQEELRQIAVIKLNRRKSEQEMKSLKPRKAE